MTSEDVGSEDDVEALMREARQEKPRKDLILSLLKKTFGLRRSTILTDVPSAPRILDSDSISMFFTDLRGMLTFTNYTGVFVVFPSCQALFYSWNVKLK